MATNRKRKSRTAKRGIPANVSEEYLDDLEARDFLATCTGDAYKDALSEDEARILREHRKMEGA